MRSWLFILFFTSFIVFNSFGQEEEIINEGHTEELGDGGDLNEWSEYAEEEYTESAQQRTLTKGERERIEKNTERMARQIVKEKFKEIDRQQKLQEQEEKRQKKMEKKGKDEPSRMIDKEDEPKKETRKERKLREKRERELEEQEEERYYQGHEREYEGEYEYGYESEYDANPEIYQVENPSIDSVLLAKRIAELESEMQNERDFKSAKKGKEGSKILKIKVPNCYYLNSVIYKRGDFEFTYQLDFFVHYFEHRYHHRKKFYDIDDPERKIAWQVMKLAGNTTYRKTNFNEIVDSIGILLDHSVEELLDMIITELNLEYLATGEIKINYKKKNQTRMYAKLKPSDMDNRSLGNITFYTRDKKRVIEELDASQFNSYLPPPEEIYTDSLLNLKMSLSSDSLSIKTDSLSIKKDSLSLSLPVNNTIKISLDTNTSNQKDTLTSKGNEVKTETAEKNKQGKDIVLQPEKVETIEEKQQGKDIALQPVKEETTKEDKQEKDIVLQPEKEEPVVPDTEKAEEKANGDLHEKEKESLNENTE